LQVVDASSTSSSSRRGKLRKQGSQKAIDSKSLDSLSSDYDPMAALPAVVRKGVLQWSELPAKTQAAVEAVLTAAFDLLR
jgi:hypothetical protein